MTMKRIRNHLLRTFFPGRPARRFGAFQVELTTRCPLRCRMCARSSGAEWRAADMDYALFRRLAEYFPDVETVVLEGWGEPLLYPDLIHAVRLVRAAGARAGFVTSAQGLDGRMSESLIDSGLDFMGVSLAGATPATHNAIRVHSDLSEVIRSVSALSDLKARLGVRHPRIHAVYLMLRENLREIPLVPELAARMGAEAVTLIQLVLVTSEWQEGQKLYHCTRKADPEVLAAVGEARKAAARLGIALSFSAIDPEPMAVCGENPLQNLYISVTGEVSPCVYLNPPLVGAYDRFHCGKRAPAPRLTFGNPAEIGLDAVWEHPEYRAFRDTFKARRLGAERHALAITSLSPSPHAEVPEPDLVPPPEPCLRCHRMLGF